MQSFPWKIRCATLCFSLLSITGVQLRPLDMQEQMIQLEAVKKSILDHLGLHKPPVITERMHKDEMHQMYWLYKQKLTELQGNATREETPKRRVHLLTPKLEHSKKKCDMHGSSSHRYNLVFSRTHTIHQQLNVMRAELKLCKDVLDTLRLVAANSTSKPMVNIYKVVESSHGNGKQKHKLLDSKPIDKDPLTLNVDSAVQQWVASSEKCLNLELVITVDKPFVSDGSKQMGVNDVLVLEVETQEQSYLKTRRARSISADEDCKKSEEKCCRKSLLVSFKQIGWSDWIVHPPTYEMRFCDGSCPHNYKPASMHAQIKYRMHHINKDTPAPCCVPGSYDPMVLMHYNAERKLVFTVFDDMIVRTCHCA